jgi:hypothetical protein
MTLSSGNKKVSKLISEMHKAYRTRQINQDDNFERAHIKIISLKNK